jgi:hypothetical protein
MTTFDIHAGDFGTGSGMLSGKNFSLPVLGKTFGQQNVAACLLTSVQLATEENVKKLGGTVGWGIVGGALLGPAGLLAGLLLGGRHKKLVFTVEFRNGQKMLASGDSSAFTAIQSAAFDAPAAYAASLAR